MFARLARLSSAPLRASSSTAFRAAPRTRMFSAIDGPRPDEIVGMSRFFFFCRLIAYCHHSHVSTAAALMHTLHSFVSTLHSACDSVLPLVLYICVVRIFVGGGGANLHLLFIFLFLLVSPVVLFYSRVVPIKRFTDCLSFSRERICILLFFSSLSLSLSVTKHDDSASPNASHVAPPLLPILFPRLSRLSLMCLSSFLSVRLSIGFQVFPYT
eukprot:TRINITY_DN3118_c0_g1_i1.p1 TRINITY_DN3118_c0_g1~~TRINITY_DN3118_c0_g1_i1.p1  ORF type:complete len:213 (-),score=16.67 TRINITY_DN3118_c0_g1_i1:631-1269(-)